MGQTIVGFRIDEETMEQLREQAEREERSVSGLIRRLIARHLKEQDCVRNQKEANDVRG